MKVDIYAESEKLKAKIEELCVEFSNKTQMNVSSVYCANDCFVISGLYKDNLASVTIRKHENYTRKE